MKRIALALIVCAGLGFVAGQKPATSENVAVVACTPAPAIVDTEPAVEQPQTPLVEKLLPKKPQLVDGQLSPGKNFSFSEARNAWIPIDKGQRRHLHNRQPVTAAHLIAEHGHAPSSVARWTQREIEICHANDHAQEFAAKQAARASSGHWEVQQVCGRRGCNNVRVWVQD
jgi:hypothetical protein